MDEGLVAAIDALYDAETTAAARADAHAALLQWQASAESWQGGLALVDGALRGATREADRALSPAALQRRLWLRASVGASALAAKARRGDDAALDVASRARLLEVACDALGCLPAAPPADAMHEFVGLRGSLALAVRARAESQPMQDTFQCEGSGTNFWKSSLSLPPVVETLGSDDG